MLQQHLSEEQLIELYYGDLEEATGAHAHLAGCRACDDDYRQLVNLLEIVKEAPVPERGEEYGREVYLRLLPMLEENAATELEPRWSFAQAWQSFVRSWTPIGNLTGATAMAMLLVCAFMAGRLWQPHAVPTGDPVAKQPTRERVLLVALGDHLDRSELVLLEMEHAQAAPGAKVTEADISAQQLYAEDLIADNRLYRQVAAQSGDTGVAGVLEDLERILMEIANSPSKLDEKELEDLQKRIEEKGILFKVRVIGSAVREKEQSSLPAISGGSGLDSHGAAAGKGKL
jgi:hypothetical protein